MISFFMLIFHSRHHYMIMLSFFIIFIPLKNWYGCSGNIPFINPAISSFFSKTCYQYNYSVSFCPCFVIYFYIKKEVYLLWRIPLSLCKYYSILYWSKITLQSSGSIWYNFLFSDKYDNRSSQSISSFTAFL